MANPVQFVEGRGWNQPLPSDVQSALEAEVAILGPLLQQESESVSTSGSYVGLGCAIYKTINSWITVNGAAAAGVDENVYDWISGAPDVNNDTGFYGQFIQAYTIDGYTLRYGPGSAAAAPAVAQLASNAIALNVADDILATDVLPDIVGLGVSDAGAAAAIIGLRDGGFAVFGAANNQSCFRIIKPSIQTLRALAAEDFLAEWSGEVVLLARRPGAGAGPEGNCTLTIVNNGGAAILTGEMELAQATCNGRLPAGAQVHNEAVYV